MAELRKTALKALLFLVMLTGLNFLYKHTLYRDEVVAEFPVWPEVEAAAKADIVYIGESSDVTYGDFDVSKAAIHDFLQVHFPGLKLRGITQEAGHAGHYLQILRNIPAGSPVKAVVVTMNLRSFNAQWQYSKLETALSKRMVLIGRGPALWRRFLMSFRQFSHSTEAEQAELFKERWRNDTLHFPYPMPFHHVAGWDSVLGARVWMLPKDEQAAAKLATHYVKAYAFEIDTVCNPRIADFDALLDLAESRGWKLIFNLLPENTEKATELLGDTLTRFMRANADLLTRRYTARGAFVVNQLDLLAHARFLDPGWTTEHYDEYGRRKVAQGIAHALRSYFPDAFKEVKVQTAGLGAVHFNDCEGAEKWSQMHTCVEGLAKSGKKACKVGGAEKFGVSFTAAVAALDSTKLDSVAVDFWLHQSALEHYSGLAFEASGDSVDYMWDTLGLRRFSQTLGAWSQVHVVWPVFPGLRRAERFKVYVYNPSELPIWVDDMRVQFLGKWK